MQSTSFVRDGVRALRYDVEDRGALTASIDDSVCAKSLVVAATSLLIIGCIDMSARSISMALLISAAAYAMHRRLPAFWWIVSALLVCSFCVSIRGFFRAPQAPMLFMCSLLSTLTIALLASWWWRQREQFTNGRSLTSR